MEFNLADLFESVAAAVPDRVAVAWGDERVSFRSLDERADRLATGLIASGVRAGSHIGILTHSRPEYLETMVAAFKIRAVPINVNYRYVAEELLYLFDNAALDALVLEAGFTPVVSSIADRLPLLGRHIVVDGGSNAAADLPGAIDYEELIAAGPAHAVFPPRSGDDAYIAYTGGTTGHPKGVVWRQEDIFFATMTPGVTVDRPEDVARNALLTVPPRLAPVADMGLTVPSIFVSYSLGPLMHVSGHWSAWGAMLGGGTAVLHPHYHMEAGGVLDIVERERVTMLTIVGDSMGRPIVEEIERDPRRRDLTSVLMLGSGGSILSEDVKNRLFAGLPSATVLTEAIGSSESPAQALSVTVRGQRALPALRFTADDRTAVFDEGLRRVTPGSGSVGRLATRGRVPIGYFNDPERSSRTFITVDGDRWAFPGDMATVEADGTIRLLGRGSMCINSGGEKVYPEEVEAVLKAHPAIVDAVVVGVADERFGEQVAAVLQTSLPGGAPDLEELQAHCRAHLAGHKVPRRVVVVDSVPRSPSGKPDYPWARAMASPEGPAGGTPE